MRTASAERKRLRVLDLAAVILFVLIFFVLYFTAKTGFGPIDESFYFTEVQRWLMGDRPLIDDWHFEQLNAFLQILPYWLIRTLNGGTEGIVLCLRFLALGVALVLFWFFYARWRRFGVWGLLGVALFSVYVPLTILTLNYYTMSLNGLLVVCSVLFLGKEKKHPLLLAVVGVVFSCVVVSEPFVAFVYFGWCALVLLRAVFEKRKRNTVLSGFSFILNARSWLFVTAGIVFTAVLFLIWLLGRSPLSEILRAVPEILSDTEYSVTGGEGSSIFQPEKIWEVVRYYGVLPPLGGAATLVCGTVCRRRGTLARRRRPLFFFACVCLAAAYLSATVITASKEYLSGGYAPTMLYFYYFQHAPLLLFGFVCYVLCDRPDRHLLCMLLVSTAASAMIDLASEIVLGFGGAAALPAVLVLCGAALRDAAKDGWARTNKDGKKSAERLRARAVCLLAVFSLTAWDAFGAWTHIRYPLVEGVANRSDDQRIDATASRGPLMGIRTTARVKGLYEDMLSDLDTIKNATSGPVYVTQLFSYLYLYVDLPIGSYYGWYVEGESETRQLRYWVLHPEKRPTYIYVPEYDYLYLSYRDVESTRHWKEEKLAFLATVCEYELTEGKTGSILRVTAWKT